MLSCPGDTYFIPPILKVREDHNCIDSMLSMCLFMSIIIIESVMKHFIWDNNYDQLVGERSKPLSMVYKLDSGDILSPEGKILCMRKIATFS